MASSFHRILVVIGLLSLFHSAFSAAQHRSYLRITSQQFSGLPLDMAVQAVASLLAVLWGVLARADSLRAVTAAEEGRAARAEELHNLPSFYIFNHRGRNLASFLLPH